jgi:hypothetical protein
MASLLKLSLDGSYSEYVDKEYKKLRNLDLKTRSQLLANNDHLEFEDYKEKVENLKKLSEEFKMMALGEEPDSEESEEIVNDDY